MQIDWRFETGHGRRPAQTCGQTGRVSIGKTMCRGSVHGETRGIETVLQGPGDHLPRIYQNSLAGESLPRDGKSPQSHAGARIQPVGRKVKSRTAQGRYHAEALRKSSSEQVHGNVVPIVALHFYQDLRPCSRIWGARGWRGEQATARGQNQQCSTGECDASDEHSIDSRAFRRAAWSCSVVKRCNAFQDTTGTRAR